MWKEFCRSSFSLLPSFFSCESIWSLFVFCWTYHDLFPTRILQILRHPVETRTVSEICPTFRQKQTSTKNRHSPFSVDNGAHENFNGTHIFRYCDGSLASSLLVHSKCLAQLNNHTSVRQNFKLKKKKTNKKKNSLAARSWLLADRSCFPKWEKEFAANQHRWEVHPAPKYKRKKKKKNQSQSKLYILLIEPSWIHWCE